MVIQQVQKALAPEDYAQNVLDHRATVDGNRKEVECSFNLVFVQRIYDPDRMKMSEQEELLLSTPNKTVA